MDRIARIASSARLEQQIEELLTNGLGDKSEHLTELGRLGARLVIQRAVDEEVAAFLSRARYERTPTATGVVLVPKSLVQRRSGGIGADSKRTRTFEIRIDSSWLKLRA